jgi:Skp family chaperone for outer membrane proteins
MNLFAAALALASPLLSSLALAQAVAPAPGPSAGGASGFGGPLVPGVCVISQDAVIGRSHAGESAAERLKAQAAKLSADLSAEQRHLVAREQAVSAKRATLTPQQLQAEAKALGEKERSLQAEAASRQHELEQSKSVMIRTLLDQAHPAIAKAYAAHGCGLLLAREAVVGGNLANDLTDEVVAAMNATPSPAAPPTAKP